MISEITKKEWQKSAHWAFLSATLLYFVCLVTEQYIPGFVTFHFSLKYLFWSTGIFAAIDVLFHWKTVVVHFHGFWLKR